MNKVGRTLSETLSFGFCISFSWPSKLTGRYIFYSVSNLFLLDTVIRREHLIVLATYLEMRSKTDIRPYLAGSACHRPDYVNKFELNNHVCVFLETQHSVSHTTS